MHSGLTSPGADGFDGLSTFSDDKTAWLQYQTQRPVTKKRRARGEQRAEEERVLGFKMNGGCCCIFWTRSNNTVTTIKKKKCSALKQSKNKENKVQTAVTSPQLLPCENYKVTVCLSIYTTRKKTKRRASKITHFAPETWRHRNIILTTQLRCFLRCAAWLYEQTTHNFGHYVAAKLVRE